MYLSIAFGAMFPVSIPPLFGIEKLGWVIIIFVYAYFASSVPVHKLLQPRDFVNAGQLIITMLLLFIGLLVVHPVIVAPALNPAAFASGSDIPSVMPLLFITIACGAISGFHSLASSGTTVKQLNNEKDSFFVAYGGMLLEGFLAVLVILAVAGGLGISLEKNGQLLTGFDAFHHQYATWSGVNAGMGSRLESFIVGASNILSGIGLSKGIGATLLAVFIVSFANTTLDSSVRIQRLALQELFSGSGDKRGGLMNNRYFATLLVIVPALLLTVNELIAKGGLELWRLFGTLNQLLAGIGLGLASLYLYHRRKPYLITFLPMLFVFSFTLWSMAINLADFYRTRKMLLLSLAILLFFITAWMFIAGTISLIKRPSGPLGTK